MSKESNELSAEVGKPGQTSEGVLDEQEAYREHNERERPFLLTRGLKAFSDLSEQLESEGDRRKRRAIEKTLQHLEIVIDCMTDEPLPGLTSDALETDQWLEYDELRFQYSVSRSMPTLLAAFAILVENGVTPGRWILEPLAEAFGQILDEREPEMVALRLGLQGKGSGSASPLKEYDREIERARVYFDMRTLIEEFELSHTKAAQAVIEKFGLDLAAKTLVNKYVSRAAYPPLVRKALDEHSEELNRFLVWISEDGRDDFIASFPQSAQKFLKKRPAKT